MHLALPSSSIATCFVISRPRMFLPLTVTRSSLCSKNNSRFEHWHVICFYSHLKPSPRRSRGSFQEGLVLFSVHGHLPYPSETSNLPQPGPLARDSDCLEGRTSYPLIYPLPIGDFRLENKLLPSSAFLSVPTAPVELDCAATKLAFRHAKSLPSTARDTLRM